MLGSCAVSSSIHKYNGSNNHAEAGLVGKLLLLDEDYNTGDPLNVKPYWPES